jgi:hypothetical protein
MSVSKEGGLVISAGVLALTGIIFWGTVQDKNRRLVTRAPSNRTTLPPSPIEKRRMRAFETAIYAHPRKNDWDARMAVLESLLRSRSAGGRLAR